MDDKTNSLRIKFDCSRINKNVIITGRRIQPFAGDGMLESRDYWDPCPASSSGECDITLGSEDCPCHLARNNGN